jgi:signal transduction histidine kinase
MLLSAILVGVYALFIFWRRQSSLYQQQREFITQVTHELKSPLASIQLHLETIRLRHPSPERMDSFVDTMLDDTKRLHSQIDNLLLAARLEQRRRQSELRVIDLSAFLQKYLDENRDRLPPGSKLDVNLEQGIRVAVEPDELGTALRNLLENAVLYSPAVPELELLLRRNNRKAEIVLKDHGLGMEPAELKRIFHRYYRINTPGERVRGTGLGLYIVQSVVEGCGGRVWAESKGQGQGSSFVLQLPLAE